VATPLTAPSSCAAAGTLVPASFKTSQPVPLLSWVTIDLTKEEDCDDVLDRRGATPDYDMELARNEELLKGEALEWSHTLASIPKGAKRQGRVQNLAHDEIEAELSELRKNYMAHDASHGIKDPAVQELETAVWASYRLHWQDFGHALRQANAGVKLCISYTHTTQNSTKFYWVSDVCNVYRCKRLFIYMWTHSTYGSTII
jgi:hypothetical protein